MDYGKYKYEKKKKASRNTSHTRTKEVRLRPKTGDHDIQFKVNQAKKFLKHQVLKLKLNRKMILMMFWKKSYYFKKELTFLKIL